jgi:hypothetical protein
MKNRAELGSIIYSRRAARKKANIFCTEFQVSRVQGFIITIAARLLDWFFDRTYYAMHAASCKTQWVEYRAQKSNTGVLLS